jgi:hypothetical protein
LGTDQPGHIRQARKTALVFLAVSLFCIIFDKIYALFGHGVASAFMSLMFLYPLLGGALPFFLLWLFVPRAENVRHYRLLYNCYNSGIAALTVGSTLRGVFEIAGTSSPYSIVFTVCGWTLCSIGLLLFLFQLKT